MSIKALARSSKDLQKKLEGAIDAASNKGGNKDPRIWKPTLNKETETGYARVRFLPPPEGEEAPFVKVILNACKSPTGKYYIEESRRTIGESDPFNELVARIYNLDDKKIIENWKSKKGYDARVQKKFYANVLVLEDPGQPDNVGKVMIYEFGPKIMEMIQLKNKPKFASDVAANPFDMWNGCEFIIKAIVSDRQWTYSPSTWSEPKALFPDDDADFTKAEAVWKQTHALTPFIEEKRFKSYNQLASRLSEVLGAEVYGIPVLGEGTAVASRAEMTAPTPAVRNPAPANRPAPSLQDDDDALDNIGSSSSQTTTTQPVPVRTSQPVNTPREDVERKDEDSFFDDFE